MELFRALIVMIFILLAAVSQGREIRREKPRTHLINIMRYKLSKPPAPRKTASLDLPPKKVATDSKPLY